MGMVVRSPVDNSFDTLTLGEGRMCDLYICSSLHGTRPGQCACCHSRQELDRRWVCGLCVCLSGGLFPRASLSPLAQHSLISTVSARLGHDWCHHLLGPTGPPAGRGGGSGPEHLVAQPRSASRDPQSSSVLFSHLRYGGPLPSLSPLVTQFPTERLRAGPGAELTLSVRDSAGVR